MKELRDGFETCLAGVIGITIVLTVAVLIFFVLGWLVTTLNIQVPTQQDRYENAYNTCMARETLSAEQCHDIALSEAYPRTRD